MTGSSYRVVLCEARTGIVLNDDGSRFIEGISTPSDHWFDDLGEALVCKDELLGRLPFANVEVTVTAGPAGFQPLTFRPDPALSLPLLSSLQARVESSSATSPQRPARGLRIVALGLSALTILFLACSSAVGVPFWLSASALFAATLLVVTIGALLGRAEDAKRRQLEEFIASQNCPRCGATLGSIALAPLGPTVDLRASTKHGQLTSATCRACGARTDFTSRGVMLLSWPRVRG